MFAKVEASPLQLQQLVFTRVHVDALVPSDVTDDIWAPDFDFTDVEFAHEVMVMPKEGQEEDPREFILALKFAIPNNNENSKLAPYTVDVQAQAIFTFAPIFEPKKRESLVTVNGCSMVIGAIREMLCQLTARSVYGPMTLPTLRFIPEPEKKEEADQA
ncbi:hypothetical protein [Microbulbifer pacificus]|uniref:Preprotein translocase subunit SecB n=1 Tax=Microbulbifer pacificus TaxID=407164 RepID=A0AAU0MW48_9GAMM|nr:hypothetical protein [Microbulbifer pacificus]WOX04718.1 hypothetical protein R5R33_13345 [Microbulbifer pacificus]